MIGLNVLRVPLSTFHRCKQRSLLSFVLNMHAGPKIVLIGPLGLSVSGYPSNRRNLIFRIPINSVDKIKFYTICNFS